MAPPLGSSVARRTGVLLAGAGVLVAAAIWVFRNSYTIPPFALVGAYAFAALLFVFKRVKRGRWVVYNCAFVVLALTVGEVALFYSSTDDWKDEAYEGTYTQHHFTDLPELGYGSIREKRVTTARKYVGGKLVYDVKYTMDDHGLRTTSGRAERAGPPVLFFGCSFTFGEGVGDTETLPASLGRISGEGMANFGFHGYGPHHMLRALEIGLPQAFGYRESAMVVYVLLPVHVDRAAGRSPWDSKGPKYRIVRGRLQFMGPFSAGQDRIALDRVREDRSPLSRVLARSAIFRLLTRRTGLPRNEDEDRRTLIAIVAEADRLVKSQYGVPLTVLLWDVGPAYPLMHERGDQLKRELASEGIPVVALSERAPQLDELRFYFPNEGHPNGAAYAEAAQVLARWRRNR